MSFKIKPSGSVQLAILAVSLSAWVEGSAQLRSFAVSNISPLSDVDPPYEEFDNSSDGDSSSVHWLWKWMKRKGKALDEGERAAMGAVDVACSFIVLHLFRSRPLLPYLMSPLLSTFPIPISNRIATNPIKWSRILATILLLSLIHEAERVTVVGLVRSWRAKQRCRSQEALGEIVVQGRRIEKPLPLEAQEAPEYEHEREHDECMICSEVGIDLSMAQPDGQELGTGTGSTSMTHDTLRISSLGPLEAFCTNAPNKHVAHRACFLRWHAAYQEQRRTLGPYLVQILRIFADGQSSETRPSKAKGGDRIRESTWAQAILKAGGFGYLVPTHTVPVGAPPLPTLTLHDVKPLTHSIPTPSRHLATLHTSSPPCPGCRSAVDLQFISYPIAKAFENTGLTWNQVSERFAILWRKDWQELVTGRTIILRLLTNLSFLLALVSMIRARPKARVA